MTSHSAHTGSVMYAQVRRLQFISVAWMVVEVLVALVAAWRAQSIALLAFGADSVIELASALVVLFRFTDRGLSERVAARTAAVLLFLLAAFIVSGSTLSLLGYWLAPQPSYMGIALLAAAGFVMPWLARQKRRLAHENKSSALAADATQSAVCGWLSWIALAGLAVNALFRVPWADELAALALVPLVIKEGTEAWREKACLCC